jgi:dihydroorotase (multifunctional complex type)
VSYDLVLENGQVMLPQGLVSGVSIGVRDGKIAALSAESLDGAEVLDLDGLTVIPGVIDEHFHVFRGYPWETHEGATRAAAKGGVTTVVDMPIDKPAILSSEDLAEKRAAIADSCYVDYALFGGYPASDPDDMARMVEGGVVVFKLFTGELSPPGMYPGVTDAQVLDAMRRAKALDATIVVHCENESIVEFETARLRAEGRQDLEVWDEARSWFAELDASQRVALLAEVTGCRTVIAHATSPRVAEAIADSRRRGADVWVETTPHNLLVAKEDMAQDIRLKWNPPSRSGGDVDELWKLLAEGDVHTVGSDNAPLPKVDGADIWSQVPGAGNAVETMFPVFATEAVRARGLSLERVVEVSCTVPAKLFSLYPRKGVIAVGSDADFAVIETERTRKIDAQELEYQDDQPAWSPFDGQDVSFYPVYTILRGRVIYKDGEVLGNPGDGQLVTGAQKAVA